MNMAGRWKVSGDTVAGRQEGMLVFEMADGVLTGRYHSSLGKHDLNNLLINGSDISWNASVRFPLPLKAEFKGTIIDENNFSGAVHAGVFGTIHLQAVRLEDAAL